MLLPAAEQGAGPDMLGLMPATLGSQDLLPAGLAGLDPPTCRGGCLTGLNPPYLLGGTGGFAVPPWLNPPLAGGATGVGPALLCI